MRKSKRLWAVMLAFVMMVNLIPATVTGTVSEAADSTEAVRYVSASGDDTANDGTTADTAYESIKKAITDLNGVTADNKVVKIVGECAWAQDDIPAHAGMITISGNDSTAKLVVNGNKFIKGGTLTFENLIFKFISTDYGIWAFGNEVILGDGIQMAGSDGTVTSLLGATYARLGIGAIAGHTVSGKTTPYVLTQNSGDFYYVHLGDQSATSNRTTPGVNYTLNGGRANMITIGADGSYKNIYSDNVNIVVNGFDMPSYPPNLTFAGTSAATITNKVDLDGNAIQIICNNGVSIKDGTIAVNATNVATAGGSLYRLNCAAALDGSILEPTETKGVYQVNGGMTAVASDGNGGVYTSVAGLLTVPAAGSYTVSWTDTVPDTDTGIVYVDGTNGLDTNDGATSETAFATLKQAMLALQTSQASSKKIVIVNGYTFKGWSQNDYTTHSDKITITGATTDTKLTVSGNAFIQGGPITLEGITIVYTKDTEGGLYALGNALTIGANVTVQWTDPTTKPNLSQFTPYLGTSSHYGSGKSGASTQGTHKLTLSGGRFYEVFLSDNYLVTANDKSSIPGVDFVMNEGSTVVMLSIGGTGLGKNVYTDNVNLTFNGGNLTRQLNLANGFATPDSKLDFGGNAVQLIYNYGIIPKLGENFTVENIEASNGVLYQMNCAATTGCALETTDTAGVYTVVGDKVAIAVNQADVNERYISANGTLTVPAEGVYDVMFKDAGDYVNAGTKLLVYNDCTIDLGAEDALAFDNKIFIGWADAEGNGVTGTSFTAGTELTATYMDFDAENNLAINGTQIYKVADVAEDDHYIRLTSKINSGLIGTLRKMGAMTYGTVYLSYDALGTAELNKETAGVVNVNGENNVIANDGQMIIFAAKLTNMQLADCQDAYVYKAYVDYTDINGNTRTYYTDYATSSEYLATKRLQKAVSDMDAADVDYFSEITEYAETTLRDAIIGAATKAVTAAEHTALIDEAKAAEVYSKFYRYTEGDLKGLIVREIDIDGVNAANEELVEVVQLTDIHLNAINSRDIAENNPVIMDPKDSDDDTIYGTHAGRSWQSDGATWGQAARAMKFAAQFDQTVVTGDTADYLSWGCLDLTRRVTWELYPDTWVGMGNHDPVRAMNGVSTIPDRTTIESRYKILEEYWKNDIYYSSKVLKDKVMVIQMDNNLSRFWDSQVEMLRADLATAVEKQYTVLLFMHKAIDTKDGLTTANAIWNNARTTWTLRTGERALVGINTSDAATLEIMNLITTHGDVVRGIFTGHMHSDFYLPITATTSTGESCVIPQYVLTGTQYNSGHALKINVK